MLEMPVFDPRTFAQRFAKALLRASGTSRELEVRGHRYRVHHQRLISVVRITVTASGTDYTGRFVAPDNLLIEQVTGWSEDSNGLESFRIAWTDNADQQVHFYKPNETDTLVYPVASTVLTDAGTPRAGQDPWDIALLKNEKRTFIARNNVGVGPYDVELTLHMRRLLPVK